MYDLGLVPFIQLGIALLIGFLIIYLTIPVITKVAYLKDLYDKPDNERKLHRNYITALGGTGIFIAFAIAFSISGLAENWTGYVYVMSGLIALYFCGLKDDLIGLSPYKKLGVEIATCLMIMFGAGELIQSMYGVFGVWELPMVVGIALSLFTMIVIINAYNLIDGIDGLAGGIAVLASTCFAIGFWVSGEYTMFAMATILSTVMLGYLMYNFHPASIFMGDSGSLVVGFLLSLMVIKFVSLNDNPAFNEVFGYSAPVLPVAFLIVPLYDTIRVFARRIKRGQSPFSPDSDHIHHVLLKLGWGQRRTVTYLYMANIFIVIIAITTVPYNVNISLGIILISAFLFLPTNGFKRRLLSKAGINLAHLLSSEKEKELVNHLKNLDFSNKSSQKREKEKSGI